MRDFERRAIDVLTVMVSQSLYGRDKRLANTLLESWERDGIVEMARMIVAMNEWRQRSDDATMKGKSA